VFGAIFLQEMLVAGRRQRAYFLRWVWAAILLVQLVPRVLMGLFFEQNRPGSSAMGVFIQFFDTLTAQHFFYLFLLTPALAAGAIADEKMRGTLDYLLTTCLNPGAIVLGKLAARCCQVFMVTLVALPLIAFFGVVGDLDAGYVVALFAASAIVIAGTGSMSLLASVWCRRTRDAVVGTYLALLAGCVALSVLSSVGWDLPAAALSPWHAASQDADGRWGRLGMLAAAWMTPAALCVALAIWRLRPAAAAQLSQGWRMGWGWRGERTIPEHANPVLWRERRVQGIAPFAWLRACPVWLGAPLVALLGALGLVVPIYFQLPDGVDLLGPLANEGLAGIHQALRMNGVQGWDVVLTQGSIALLVLVLLVTVRASGSITEERERSAWDALLLTPVTSREIVRGKFWGLGGACLPYLAAYVVVTCGLASLVSTMTLLTSALVVAAMLVLAPAVAAVGLFWSAFLSSSWRSLLATLAVILGYLLLIEPFLSLPSCMISAMIAMLIAALLAALVPAGGNAMGDLMPLVFTSVYGGTTLLLNAAILWPASWGLLKWAEARIEKVERARVSPGEQDQQRMIGKLERLADQLADEGRLDKP
jgi:ABC-type transport system involved in multi-copper enzyme maturation permease subunit